MGQTGCGHTSFAFASRTRLYNSREPRIWSTEPARIHRKNGSARMASGEAKRTVTPDMSSGNGARQASPGVLAELRVLADLFSLLIKDVEPCHGLGVGGAIRAAMIVYVEGRGGTKWHVPTVYRSKISSGRTAETVMFGTSTTWLIRRSTATLARQ